MYLVIPTEGPGPRGLYEGSTIGRILDRLIIDRDLQREARARTVGMRVGTWTTITLARSEQHGDRIAAVVRVAHRHHRGNGDVT